MDFQHESITVNGVPVSLLTAGKGEPLVFFHGAGTWHGFDFAKPWAERYRVIIPYHPGWGPSPDAPQMASTDDYVLHYLEMFDQLGLEKVNLVGLSMGGRFAATFAIHHRRRVRKLVLIAPAGFVIPEYPMPNLAETPAEIPSYLVSDVSLLAKHLPTFAAVGNREGASFLKVAATGLIGSGWLERWLHRINMPTMLVWGEKDRIIPIGHAAVWNKLIPHARLLRVPGAGHLPLDESQDAVKAVADFLE